MDNSGIKITDALIVILTGIYVLVTYRLLKVTSVSVKVNQEMLEEMSRSRQDQDKASFEDTFFRMISLQQDIVREITHPSTAVHGRPAIQGWHSQFASEFATLIGQPKHHPTPQSAVNYIFNSWQATFGHYFHTLYQLVRQVDRHDGIDKPTYIKIIRAQLSRAELVLLFYYCLSTTGEKFKKQVERHGLLEGFDDSWLISAGHKASWEQSAFSSDR